MIEIYKTLKVEDLVEGPVVAINKAYVYIDLAPYGTGVEELPRLTDSHGRVWQGAPLRTLRRVTRLDARAPLHPGRCAHFLHA